MKQNWKCQRALESKLKNCVNLEDDSTLRDSFKLALTVRVLIQVGDDGIKPKPVHRRKIKAVSTVGQNPGSNY